MSIQKNTNLNLLLSITTLISLLISAYYVGAKIGSMEEQLRSQTLLLTTLTNRLYDHELSGGHGPMKERMTAAEDRLDSVESRVTRIEYKRR